METRGAVCGWLVLPFLLAFCHFVLSADELQFPFGRVQGVELLSQRSQKPYTAYYGIPFAEPPVGDRRFRPPQPYQGDPSRIISSLNFRSPCFQQAVPKASEDCLHLNVFVPNLGRDGLKQVMIWIHGGGYEGGEAAIYVPSELVAYDVIVVTIQYRLGAFGFLSSQDEALPGNLGLQDQILALRWVKDNIRQFGGNQNDVTIFGQSAGASSVSFLSISPLTKGLFTKAIIQSGTAVSPWAWISNPLNTLYSLAKKTDCLPMWYNPFFRIGYHQNIINCLRKVPAKAFYANVDIVDFRENLNLMELIQYAPVVDGVYIPKDPSLLIKDKKYLQEIGTLDRSYIIGATNSEGIILFDVFNSIGVSAMEFARDIKGVSQLIRETLTPVLPIRPTTEILNLVDFMYTYPREKQREIPPQYLVDLVTDTSYLAPSVFMARALAAASDQTNVFLYLFDHYPQMPDANTPYRGSVHGFDIFFEFDEFTRNSKIPVFPDVSPQDKPLFDVFRGALTTFAKTGSPSRAVARWPRFDLKDEWYMAISTQPEARQRVNARRMSLWTEFLPKMVGSLFTGNHGRLALKIKH